MNKSFLKVVIVSLGTATILGCSMLQSERQLQVSHRPELDWPLLPSMPTSCFNDPKCRVNRGDSRLEMGSSQFEDWNDTSPSTPKVERNRDGSNISAKREFVILTREIDKVFAEAHKKSTDAQSLSGILEKTVFRPVKTEPKQLPPRPEAVGNLMDSYRQSNEFLDCLQAYYSLEIASNLKNISDAKKTFIKGAVYTRYVDSCLKPAVSSLMGRLALFWTTYPPDSPFGFYCLGFDLDGTHIVTAKHCVADPALLELIKNGDSSIKDIALSPRTGSKISFANDPKVAFTYHISPLHKDLKTEFYSPSNIGDDIAVVVLDKPRQVAPIDVSPHRSWDRIVTLTSFYPYEQFRKCGDGISNEACNLDNLIRMDHTPTCVTPIRRDACILHACQTRPGASGGPILAVRNDTYTLIGVHTGSIDDPENAPCGLPRGKFYPNYGIAIDSSVVVRQIMNLKE